MPERARHHSGLHGIGMALLLVVAMTALMLFVTLYIQPTNRSVVYLIPVIAAAVWWGVIPAVVAALAGIVSAVFFFYPPVYSFKVPQTPQLVNLALFLIIALVTGRLATAVRAQAEIARKRETEVRELYGFSRRLATARAAPDIYAAIQEHISNLIQRKAVLFEDASAELVDVGRRTDQWVPESVHAEVVKYACGDGRSHSGSTVDDGAGHLWLVRHVVPKTPEFGVIAIALGRANDSSVEEIRGRIDEVLADAAATLDRLDIARVIDDARMRSETENLREALIGSVSHELRTPLASILGSATVLCNTPTVAGDERLGALANVIRDEAERLNSDIQNLLDATRITSQSIKPLQQWYEPADLVNSAVERRGRRLSGHLVTTDVASDLPLIYVDPVLMEQALVQIIDNAAKYSPSGSTIIVRAAREGDEIVLSVTDRGSGFTEEERERLGERFFRGRRHLTTISGSGLGLWIANAFVTASDGELDVASDGVDQGSTVAIRLPVVREAILQLERAVDE
jgi:two-component system, OmpR family, sensor histidine kinase KdpD